MPGRSAEKLNDAINIAGEVSEKLKNLDPESAKNMGLFDALEEQRVVIAQNLDAKNNKEWFANLLNSTKISDYDKLMTLMTYERDYSGLDPAKNPYIKILETWINGGDTTALSRYAEAHMINLTKPKQSETGQSNSEEISLKKTEEFLTKIFGTPQYWPEERKTIDFKNLTDEDITKFVKQLCDLREGPNQSKHAQGMINTFRAVATMLPIDNLNYPNVTRFTLPKWEIVSISTTDWRAMDWRGNEAIRARLNVAAQVQDAVEPMIYRNFKRTKEDIFWA